MRPLSVVAALLGVVGAAAGLVVLIREITYKHSSRVIEGAGVGILLVGLAVLLLVIDQAQARRS